jgi:hypothetical protein
MNQGFSALRRHASSWQEFKDETALWDSTSADRGSV